MATLVGQTVSHDKVLEKLGEGGMGVVYEAEDTRLKRTVALKFLPPDLTRDPEAKKRFVHEAKATSALDHPNIRVVHDIGVSDHGQMFLVMAHHEGETLPAVGHALLWTRSRAGGHEIDQMNGDLER